MIIGKLLDGYILIESSCDLLSLVSVVEYSSTAFPTHRSPPWTRPTDFDKHWDEETKV